LGLAVIAAIYVGFAVADGRPTIIGVESGVAFAFVVVAAAGVTGRARWGVHLFVSSTAGAPPTLPPTEAVGRPPPPPAPTEAGPEAPRPDAPQ
jgi:hypothetical protein